MPEQRDRRMSEPEREEGPYDLTPCSSFVGPIGALYCIECRWSRGQHEVANERALDAREESEGR